MLVGLAVHNPFGELVVDATRQPGYAHQIAGTP